jgi:crossover junction endodeoxyribonuclease RusA
MPTTITLPLPISTNRIWRAGRGGHVYRSPQYRAWVTEAGWSLRAQRPKSVAGPVSVTIAAGRPDRRRRDVDNLAKALLDLLVQHRVLEDDSKVTSFAARWDSSIAPGRVAVTVAPAN